MLRVSRPDAGEKEAGWRSALPLPFSRCANPRCATGWIRLWRNRRVPGFEGQWACSPECMMALVAAAMGRERAGGDAPVAGHMHRVPLGLMLVEQGVLAPEILRQALAAQQQAGAGRLGQWLLESGVLNETALTRALSAQWNCPVLPMAGFRPEETVAALPHLFSEALGALPVRAGRRLEVAFAGPVDRALSYALERMTGLPVTAGLARDSAFGPAQARYLATAGPQTRILEAAGSAALVRALTAAVEKAKPREARLVRVHAWYWLRMWRRTPAEGRLPEATEVEDWLGRLSPGSSGVLRLPRLPITETEGPNVRDYGADCR